VVVKATLTQLCSAASTGHQPCASDDLNVSEMQTFDLLSLERRTSGQEMLRWAPIQWPPGLEGSENVEFQS
jgi:hypothetical protein